MSVKMCVTRGRGSRYGDGLGVLAWRLFFLFREMKLNSDFQNIWRTNSAIPLTASDSSSYVSDKCSSWFGVLTAALDLVGYDAMSSDQVTNRQGIMSQKTCIFNKLLFIRFVVNVISRYFTVTPINVVCEQFSQYCVLNL